MYFFVSKHSFLTEGELLHNIVLASAIHQRKSAKGVHVSPPSWPSLPPPTPSHPLGCYRALVWASWVTQKTPVGYLFYMWWVCVSMLPSPFIPRPPSLPLPRVHNFSVLRLHCCPVNRLISTIFLDSIHMHLYRILVLLFLTYFTLYNRLQVHLPH